MQTANTIRISSEALSKGRCANCYKPIYRVPNSVQYRHRHNHSESCIEVNHDPLIVADLHTHSGDTSETIMLKCVKTLHKLVTAHNLLVMEWREERKLRGQEITHVHSYELKRDFIGMPRPAIKTEDAIALMKQFKHICRCVAPIPVLITGSGHIQLCSHCKRIIVEEDNE